MQLQFVIGLLQEGFYFLAFMIAGIVQDDVNFVSVLEFLLNFTKEISDRIAVYFLVRFGDVSNFVIGNIDDTHVVQSQLFGGGFNGKFAAFFHPAIGCLSLVVGMHAI